MSAEKRRKQGLRRPKGEPFPETRPGVPYPETRPVSLSETRPVMLSETSSETLSETQGTVRAWGSAADDEPVSEARWFEAFGRVMAALAGETEFIDSCRDLTWWRGGGQSWHIEWRDGPHASELAALLGEHVRDPGLPGSLSTEAGPSSRSHAAIKVMGVRFELSAVDPVGRAKLTAKPGFWRLAEALDTTRRTNTRHPWEVLLGG